MIKLSRAGWNNVIIFGVLAFILLINATHDDVFSVRNTNSSELGIFGDNKTILTLTVNEQVKVERIGTTWRATPSVISGQALDQMMYAWQKSIGESTKEPENLDKQLALIVSAELAGESITTVLNIHVTDLQFLVYNQTTKQWLVFPMQIYNQLLPAQLFSQ